MKLMYSTLVKGCKNGETVGYAYSSYVLADSEEEANKIIKLRGTKEKLQDVLPVKRRKNYFFNAIPLAKSYRKKNYLELLHTLCYVSVALIKSKQTDLNDLLGENGCIHETVHCLLFNEYKIFNKNFHKRLKQIDDYLVDLGYLP